MNEILISKGCLENKITLCTNWGDLATNIDISRREALINFKLEEYEGKLIIQYFGNIGKLQNISFILNAITESKNKDLLFLFIGQGSEVKEVKKYAKECSKIIYFESVELHQRDMILQACDIAIVSLKNEMKGLAVPSKSYFSLSSNKPIITIAHEKSEVALMVAEMNAGWVCSPTDNKQLISLLDKLSFAEISKFRNLKSIVEDYYNPSARLSLIESTMKIS